MAGVRKGDKSYDSADVVVSILGQIESEVKNISYESDQEHQVNHSLASAATSWSRGKETHTCTLGLYMNAVKKLEQVSNGRLLDIAPFDITVTYVNEFNDIITDIIVCKFKKAGRQVNGDMGLAYDYEMFVLDIKYNV